MVGSPETLAGNLRALEQALGHPVRLPSDAGHVAVDPGPPATASLRDADGHPLLFHSRRNPLAEAEHALCAAVGASPPSTLVVMGAGLGYLLEAASHHLPHTRVLVIEPEPAFSRHMLSRRDWREQLASGRLLMLMGPHYEGASAAWRMVDEAAPPVTIEHPVLARMRPQEVAEGRAVVAKIWFDARANADARRRLEAPYLLNTLRNLPVLAREADAAALDGRFAGRPAVLVAAGPSLDRQLEDLRALQDHALIVAVDTAMRPLVAAGVHPHLVVAVDPSEANAAHLAGLPGDLDTWLVGEGSLHPAAFSPFAGRTFCCRVAAHEPWPWLHAAGLDAGVLQAWGSVLTTAFDLALRMGCSPIVFAGADLAYTGGRPYCRGTVHERDWALAVARGAQLGDVWRAWVGNGPTVRVVGVDETKVDTAPRLVAFRDWIVDAAARHPERRVVNATPGGILRGGRIALQPLLEAVPPGGALLDRRPILAAWQSATAPGRVGIVLDAIRALGQDTHAATVERWRQIAAPRGVAIADAILSAAQRFDADDRAQGSTGDMAADAALPGTVARVRRFMRGEPPPDLSGSGVMGGAPSTPAGRDAAVALLGAASTLASTRPALPPGDVSRVFPLAAWSCWSRDESFQWLQFEGAVGRLFDPDGARAEPAPDPLMTIDETPWTDDCGETAAEVPSDLLRLAAILESMLVVTSGPGARRVDDLRAAGSIGALVRAGGLRRLLENLIFNVGRQLTGDPRDGADGLTLRAQLAAVDGTSVTGAATRIRPRYLMRALTGLVREAETALVAESTGLAIQHAGARWRLDVEGSAMTLASPARFLSATHAVAPTSVSGALPPCLFASPLSASEAVLGAVHTPDSYAVDQDGCARPLSTWPKPLIGEIPWGERGGAMAWNTADRASYVMLRRAAGGPVETHPLPFRPSWPIVEPDGATLWSSYFGGLWSWHPDRGSQCLAEAPPSLGIRPHAAGVRLDPAIKHATGVSVRALHHQAWRWEHGTSRVTPLALGSHGVSWSLCERAGWAAEAHPHGDVVRITAPSGRAFELACYFPVSVAWAGSSLVVTSTTGGRVLLFRHIRDILEAWP